MTPHRVGLTVQSESKSQESFLIMDWGPTLGAIRRRFQDIAQAEFRKQRKRLGVLSAEQETAIEALLMSTVNKISHRVIPEIVSLTAFVAAAR
jgi:glutamyl-tRNA reductase